jgi:hypothetical protein
VQLSDVPTPARRWVARGLVLVLVAGLVAPAATDAATYDPSSEETTLQRGEIERPANGTTVISVQGFKFAGEGNEKKPSRIVGVGPRGEVEWVHTGLGNGPSWFYDVDPLANGNVLIVSIVANQTTLVYEFDPVANETVWRQHLDARDTHDVDLINGDQLLVANMRDVNETSGEEGAGLFVYDMGTDEVVWEFLFRNHYPEDVGGAYGKHTPYGWSHVNDVDKVANGSYLASPRNFDQVILVNRSRNEISLRLGRDENHDVVYEQHNPEYLEGVDGRPAILVADSANDRVVEYALEDGEWVRTWTLGTGRNLTWPRDADRLPNGNTLVTDTNNHRVIEVTPSGEVVWEFYAPWGTYEAERMAHGDEPGGPTIAEQNATGAYEVTGSAGLAPGTGARLSFADWVAVAFAGTPLREQAAWVATRWSHVAPWVRPVWMTTWGFVYAIAAGVVLVAWAGAEAVLARRRLVGGAASLVRRGRDAGAEFVRERRGD